MTEREDPPVKQTAIWPGSDVPPRLTIFVYFYREYLYANDAENTV